MDPVVNKLIKTTADSPAAGAGDQPGKSGASKFDQISSQLKDGAGSEATSPPSNSDLSADGVQVRASSAPDQLRQNLAASQYHLAHLREKVESTSGASSITGLQSRLASIEHQYTVLDSAVKAMPPGASPQQWIALQEQVYSMNESIGVLSKMIGQAASGVKSVLQTQV